MDASRKKTPPDAPDAPLAAVAAAIATHWPETLLRSGQSHVEVALSGGVDSVVLLCALSSLATARGVRLTAVHVHHGLSPNADHWAAFCTALCARLQVPLRIERVRVDRGGGSLEAAARHARYRAIAAGGADVVALAHHADDLAETVLLQALRGGGARALAAMPVLRQSGHGGWLWRPLLQLARADIEQAARQAGLDWIEDESNADPRYRRNAIRHQLVPVLANHFPDYRRQLARTAVRAADEAAVLADVAASTLPGLTGADGALALTPLLQRPLPWQRLLLAAYLERQAVSVSPALLETLLAQAAHGFELRVGDRVLLGYRGTLLVRPDGPLPSATFILPLVEGEVPLPGWPGTLRLSRQAVGGVALADGSRIEVRPPADGETLAQGVGHKACRKLWQEAGLAPWRRQRWPRLWADGALLALPGIAVASDRLARPGETGWAFGWVESGQ